MRVFSLADAFLRRELGYLFARRFLEQRLDEVGAEASICVTGSPLELPAEVLLLNLLIQIPDFSKVELLREMDVVFLEGKQVQYHLFAAKLLIFDLRAAALVRDRLLPLAHRPAPESLLAAAQPERAFAH